MCAKFLGPALGLCLVVFGNHLALACDQLAPNPNPSGSVAINASANGCIESPYINNGVVRNEGTLADNASSNSPVTFTNNGTVDNFGTFQWRLMVNNGYFDNSGDLHGAPLAGAPFQNNGVVANTGTIGIVGSVFRNGGALFNDGTILVSDGLVNEGYLVNNTQILVGVAMFNGGTLINNGTIGPANGGAYLQSGGATVNDGVMNQGWVQINGGLLQGNGTIVNDAKLDGFPGGSRVEINGGVLNAGDAGKDVGTLTVDGRFVFASGTFLTEIGGDGLADLLKVTDTASFLGGAFTFSFLNQYLPDLGDEWTFLTADKGITGWENLSLAFVGIPSNYLFNVAERDNSLVVSVAAVPEPEVYASMILGLAVLGVMSKRRKRTRA